MPYYYDPKIEDTSESDVTRRKAVLNGIQITENTHSFVKEKYSSIKSGLAPHISKRPFIDAIEDSVKRFPDVISAHKHWAETDPELKRKATQAEKFDSHVITRFYGLLSLGMLYRCVKNTDNKKVEAEIFQHITERNKELESMLSYKVIPIKNLVRVQLGSALLTTSYLNEEQ